MSCTLLSSAYLLDRFGDSPLFTSQLLSQDLWALENGCWQDLPRWMTTSFGCSYACVGPFGGVITKGQRGVLSRSLPAPPPGYIKINFDGATFRKGRELGVGMFARGNAGECLAWILKKLYILGDGEMAEELAARNAVLLAIRKEWPLVIFEGDCDVVISKILSPKSDISVIGPKVIDIRLFISGFHSCSFQFVSRAWNVVAHTLAQSTTGSLEGDSVFPPAVAPYVIADLSS
ncbi:UNVERIFIED_CONTAM: hypothetical protein Sangu_0393100 [Sesamum angustifolium]|uniref:RNase H type-1 domain-containing protein n=1 Tax=Sesamum angustifolium TaxID=2727405 RepID=A0AAW2QSX9_9LAMI